MVARIRGEWKLNRRKAGGPHEFGNVIAMRQIYRRNVRILER